MRIVQIILSNSFAGAERLVYYLSSNFKKSKTECSIITNDDLKKYFNSFNAIVIGKFSDKTKFNIQLSIFKFKKILFEAIKKIKPEIIHCHSNIPTILYSKIFNKLKIPYVITLHGSDVYNFVNSKSIIYKIFTKPQFKKALDNAALITSVSSSQIKNLPEKYKKKTIVIPNGVDSKIFKPLKNIKQNKNVVLFVSRFIDIKGIRELINVAKQLPKYEFWFAGKGELEYLIKGKNIKNLGFKTTEELVKLYNQATICIFPSYREGFPLCGLEAMACGCSVIATPLGFSEYIENNKDGIIIPAKDEKALKKAIVKLMTNEQLRKKLGKNSRKKALKYSWSKVAERYLEVFEKVIKDTPQIKLKKLSPL